MGKYRTGPRKNEVGEQNKSILSENEIKRSNSCVFAETQCSHDNPHLYGVIKDENAASAVMKLMSAAFQNPMKSVTRANHFPANNIIIPFICVLIFSFSCFIRSFVWSIDGNAFLSFFLFLLRSDFPSYRMSEAPARVRLICAGVIKASLGFGGCKQTERTDTRSCIEACPGMLLD